MKLLAVCAAFGLALLSAPRAHACPPPKPPALRANAAPGSLWFVPGADTLAREVVLERIDRPGVLHAHVSDLSLPGKMLVLRVPLDAPPRALYRLPTHVALPQGQLLLGVDERRDVPLAESGTMRIEQRAVPLGVEPVLTFDVDDTATGVWSENTARWPFLVVTVPEGLVVDVSLQERGAAPFPENARYLLRQASEGVELALPLTSRDEVTVHAQFYRKNGDATGPLTSIDVAADASIVGRHLEWIMFEPSAPSTSRWALLTGTALLASALLRRRRRVVVAP